MRAVITGGGTGGHIYPALAIGEKLRSADWEVLYLGVAGAMEERLSQKQGFPFAAIPAEALSHQPVALLKAAALNGKGINKAHHILKEFSPAVVVGTGGFASAPSIFAAQMLHIPTVLHEQNAFPGRANRLLAKKAAAICLTFAAAGEYFPHPERQYLTGLPIRAQILTSSRQKGREALDIPADASVLLITGGSLGAAHLNRSALAIGEKLLADGWWVIHICGREEYLQVKQQAPKDRKWLLFPYVDQMENPLWAADLTVCRAGASFLAEVAAVGLPSILVPYPYAANDHQRFNAKAFASAGAACILEDSDLKGETLLKQIREIQSTPGALTKMSAAALRLAETDAVGKIYSIIQRVQ